MTSANSRLHLARPASSGQTVESLTQTFYKSSAHKYANERYLDVSIRDRDASIGNNSSTQAEGKHDFTVNRTKTPKLGIHMKALTNKSGIASKRLIMPNQWQEKSKLD